MFVLHEYKYIYIYTNYVLFAMATENDPFVDDLPIFT
jgi:hypothetical protein